MILLGIKNDEGTILRPGGHVERAAFCPPWCRWQATWQRRLGRELENWSGSWCRKPWLIWCFVVRWLDCSEDGDDKWKSKTHSPRSDFSGVQNLLASKMELEVSHNKETGTEINIINNNNHNKRLLKDSKRPLKPFGYVKLVFPGILGFPYPTQKNPDHLAGVSAGSQQQFAQMLGSGSSDSGATSSCDRNWNNGLFSIHFSIHFYLLSIVFVHPSFFKQFV